MDTKPTAAQLASSSRHTRSKRGQALEEDATKLQFGEFADGEALTVGEVNRILQISRSGQNVPPAPDNKVYKATIDHVNEFTNAEPAVAESMRAALVARHGFLNMFEIAQIMYLRPEKIEVAVALIPSLERYNLGDENEDILQGLLDEVRGIARYGATTS